MNPTKHSVEYLQAMERRATGIIKRCKHQPMRLYRCAQRSLIRATIHLKLKEPKVTSKHLHQSINFIKRISRKKLDRRQEILIAPRIRELILNNAMLAITLAISGMRRADH